MMTQSKVKKNLENLTKVSDFKLLLIYLSKTGKIFVQSFFLFFVFYCIVIHKYFFLDTEKEEKSRLKHGFDVKNMRKNKPEMLFAKSVDLPDLKSETFKDSYKALERCGSTDLTGPSSSIHSLSPMKSAEKIGSRLQKPIELNLKNKNFSTNRFFNNMPHVLTSPSDVQDDKYVISSSDISQKKESENLPKSYSPENIEKPYLFEKNVALNDGTTLNPLRLQIPPQRHSSPRSSTHETLPYDTRSFKLSHRPDMFPRRPLPPFYTRPMLRPRFPLRMPADALKPQFRSIAPFVRKPLHYHQTPEHHHLHLQLSNVPHHTNSLPRSFKQIVASPPRFLQQFQHKASAEQSDSDDDDGDWC